MHQAVMKSLGLIRVHVRCLAQQVTIAHKKTIISVILLVCLKVRVLRKFLVLGTVLLEY
jgi:hypothetical protein